MAGKLSRRDLLKAVGVGAGALAVPAVLAKKAHAQATAYGILVDTRRCVNCKACQISCKMWNDNEPDPTTFKTSFSKVTWTYVQEDEVGATAKCVTTKRQCMHCEDPVCVKHCPMDGRAIHKADDGPVLINHANCMRCLNCVRHCPYGVPKFDIEANKVLKCVFCVGRLREEPTSLEPACVNTCVAGALQKGTLAEITALANAAIGDGCTVYGLDAGWKTSWIYVFPAGVDPWGIMTT